MGDEQWLVERFEECRGQLRAVAYRMLGSAAEADDAVQETWLRASRADSSSVDNLPAWLTTILSRICLDMLRSRTARREQPLDPAQHEQPAGYQPGIGPGDPEHEALLADTVGPALLLILDTLAPPERLAFVLHDMFTVPFTEIATILNRSPQATRQLASRARRRVQGPPSRAHNPDHARQHQIVTAFLAASRQGDFDALLTLLHPEATLHTDGSALLTAQPSLTGARAIATSFTGRAQNAQPALIDGQLHAVWAPHGTPRVTFTFTTHGNTITRITLAANPRQLAQHTITVLTDDDITDDDITDDEGIDDASADDEGTDEEAGEDESIGPSGQQ
ncbi:MAG: sigma-70 family RNA polymerase sigma factor [Jatrophihabitans sp.]